MKEKAPCLQKTQVDHVRKHTSPSVSESMWLSELRRLLGFLLRVPGRRTWAERVWYAWCCGFFFVGRKERRRVLRGSVYQMQERGLENVSAIQTSTRVDVTNKKQSVADLGRGGHRLLPSLCVVQWTFHVAFGLSALLQNPAWSAAHFSTDTSV